MSAAAHPGSGTIADPVEWFQRTILGLMADGLELGEGNQRLHRLLVSWDFCNKAVAFPAPPEEVGARNTSFGQFGSLHVLRAVTGGSAVVRRNDTWAGASIDSASGGIVDQSQVSLEIPYELFGGRRGFVYRGTPGAEFRMWVYPLIVDEDRREAWFPLVFEIDGDTEAIKEDLGRWLNGSSVPLMNDMPGEEPVVYGVAFGAVPVDNEVLTQVDAMGIIDPGARSRGLPRWEEIEETARAEKAIRTGELDPRLLVSEAQALMREHGRHSSGYLLSRRGVDGEFHTRCVPTNQGEAEVGIAYPDDARRQVWRNARLLFESLALQAPRQRKPDLVLPASELRDLFGLQGDSKWRVKIREAADFLNRCRFLLVPFKQRGSVTVGSVLSSYTERKAGSGSHADGEFTFRIEPCLWSVIAYHLKGDLDPASELVRQAAKNESGARRTFSWMEAGASWLGNGLDCRQRALLRFVQQNLVRQRAGGRSGNHRPAARTQVSFTNGSCPLIPPGERFLGAVGVYRSGFGFGWTMDGSLLDRLGYRLDRDGRRTSHYKRIVERVLADFDAVVVERMCGLVAARRKTVWLDLKEASALPAQTVATELTWYFFVPEDWTSRVRSAWEDRMSAEGRPVRSTNSQDEVGRYRGRGVGEVELCLRLKGARERRGVSQPHAARELGVSQQLLSAWEGGGKKIPEKRKKRIEEWIRG